MISFFVVLVQCFKTRSYINRSSVHWRIGGKQSYGSTLCGSTDSANKCSGGECCWGRSTSIQRGASGSTIIHIGVSDGKSTTKGDGDGKACIESCNKEKMHNPR